MRLGQKVLLFRDGVPYVYRLTLKGWLVAQLIQLKNLLHTTPFPKNESK